MKFGLTSQERKSVTFELQPLVLGRLLLTKGQQTGFTSWSFGKALLLRRTGKVPPSLKCRSVGWEIREALISTCSWVDGLLLGEYRRKRHRGLRLKT